MEPLSPISRVACIGEAMVELGFPDTRSKANVGFAGDTLNTAIYLARSLAMIENRRAPEVAFVSALGDDPFSTDMKTFIEDESISTDSILTLPGRMPGLYSITTDNHGERSFHYWRDQSAARDLFGPSRETICDALEQCQLIYFSGITLAVLRPEDREDFLSWVERYRTLPGRQVAFDSNYRPRLWESREVAQSAMTRAWSATDIGLPSADDEGELFGSSDSEAIKERLLSLGVHQGAIKRGPSGPVSLSSLEDEPTYEVRADVIDTTAAGDSFNGAYLAALLTGENQRTALLNGHRCAARVIGTSGAIIPKAIW